MKKEQAINYKKIMDKMLIANKNDKIGFISKLCIAAICSTEGESNKFDRTLEIIKELLIDTRKIIIFSSFNKPLEVLSKILFNNRVSNFLLTGEIKTLDRNKLIEKFKSDNKTNVLLCNSKIGGEGFTITEASCIVFKRMVESFFK